MVTHQQCFLGEKEPFVLAHKLQIVRHAGIAQHRIHHLAAQLVVQHLHTTLQQTLQLGNFLGLNRTQLASFLPDFEASRLSLLIHQNIFGEQAEPSEEPIACKLTREKIK